MIVEQQLNLGTHRRHTRLVRRALGMLVLTISTLVMAPQSYAADSVEQQQLVDKARLTLEAFAADPGLKEPIREWKHDMKALFIVPQFYRGAFVFGGAGGSGVLLVRDEKTGAWSEPAFYTMGSASFGLQIGGDVSEMVFVVRTQKGLEGFYRTDFKLGADVSMAVGPVGAAGRHLLHRHVPEHDHPGSAASGQGRRHLGCDELTGARYRDQRRLGD